MKLCYCREGTFLANMVCLKGSKTMDKFRFVKRLLFFSLLPLPTTQVRQSLARCISILAES